MTKRLGSTAQTTTPYNFVEHDLGIFETSDILDNLSQQAAYVQLSSGRMYLGVHFPPGRSLQVRMSDDEAGVTISAASFKKACAAARLAQLNASARSSGSGEPRGDGRARPVQYEQTT